MNKERTRNVLLLSALALFSSCTREQKPQHIGSHHGALDIQRIGDVYGLSGAHPLIGFVIPATHTVYVAERARERVMKALAAKEEKGQTWIIGLSELNGEYKMMSLDNLDLQQPLNVGMAAVNEKATCMKTTKDECSNMYDKNDKFRYSWNAPKDLFMCEWTETQDCTDIWKEETIDVYSEEDCKGTKTTKKQRIAFCTPV
jgi:hypothetical protein